MTIKAQTPTCPRCRQPVEIGAKYGQIKPHTDRLVGAPCPMAGYDLGEAARAVENARRLLGLPERSEQ